MSWNRYVRKKAKDKVGLRIKVCHDMILCFVRKEHIQYYVPDLLVFGSLESVLQINPNSFWFTL